MLAPAVSSYVVEAYDASNNLVYCEGIFPDTLGFGILLGWYRTVPFDVKCYMSWFFLFVQVIYEQLCYHF